MSSNKISLVLRVLLSPPLGSRGLLRSSNLVTAFDPRCSELNRVRRISQRSSSSELRRAMLVDNNVNTGQHEPNQLSKRLSLTILMFSDIISGVDVTLPLPVAYNKQRLPFCCELVFECVNPSFLPLFRCPLPLFWMSFSCCYAG